MAIAQRYVAQQQMGRGGPSGLADVLEVLLDKGLVIDAFVRVSLVGIELLTVDARVVVASVDTYLRFAEAVNRLDLVQANNAQTLGDLVGRPSKGSGQSQNGDRGSSGPGGDRGQELSGGGRGDERSGPGLGQRLKDTAGELVPGHSRDEETTESGEQSSGEGGLLSRIKQRGQAF